MRRLAIRLITTGLAVLLAAAAAAQQAVDVELVLAADGSGSIDDDELRLQREGYAAAITSPEVLGAIADGVNGVVAVAYVEWGGPASQHTIVDWHEIRDAASAEAFAARLRSEPRRAYGYNSISGAIDYAAGLIRGNVYDGLRKVIDVSGDGPQIGGRPLVLARAEALADGMTINGLPIIRPGGAAMRGTDLVAHYRRDVIGGPGSFLMVADETRSFAEAVRNKLALEIAAVPQPQRLAGP